MPIVITKERGVPRRMYGFADEPLRRPSASDIVHPDVSPPEESYAPEVPYAPVLSPDEEATQADPYAVATPEASDHVVDATQETLQRSVSMGAVLTLPFFAYLALSGRLPLWARIVSGAIGAGLLVGEGGLLQRWSARDAGEEPLYGYSRRRLRGYSTPFGEITFSENRGLGCGGGCGGRCGCGG